MMHYVIALLSQIYCEGPILTAVQEAHLFNDSKYFVDMPLKHDPAATLRDFQMIADKIHDDKELLKSFVETHFNPPGEDLEECFPEDWKPTLDKFANIKDDNYRFWAEKVHQMWKGLCRKVKYDVYENPELYSLLYVPHKFIIPGGRFREFYYWDSYWIIKGLLYSEMYVTVKGMIKNFAYMVEHYGFVPNGGRVYYLLRSQPPLLIPMVYDYYMETNDIEFVREMLPVMVNEYKFWTSRRSTQYRDMATLFQYKVDMKNPRPEAYREDMELVRHLNSSSDKERMWSNIASAAETGWDFSSRWFAHEGASAYRISTVRTCSIVPVDLNAFMCMNARILAELYHINGDQTKALLYEARFTQAKMLMKQMHWNDTDGVWYDYDLEHHEHLDAYYISNALPLFAHCYDEDDETIPLRVYEYMKAIGAFNSSKGIPTSFIQSEQQWDSANSWPPMVHMIIEGFRTSKVPKLQEFGRRLAGQWLRANYLAFETTNEMYEKYNVGGTGGCGGGGEYEVQTGFGWTNGVVLDLFRVFGETIKLNETEEEASVPATLASAVYELIQSVVHPLESTNGNGNGEGGPHLDHQEHAHDEHEMEEIFSEDPENHNHPQILTAHHVTQPEMADQSKPTIEKCHVVTETMVTTTGSVEKCEKPIENGAIPSHVTAEDASKDQPIDKNDRVNQENDENIRRTEYVGPEKPVPEPEKPVSVLEIPVSVPEIPVSEPENPVLTGDNHKKSINDDPSEIAIDPLGTDPILNAAVYTNEAPNLHKAPDSGVPIKVDKVD